MRRYTLRFTIKKDWSMPEGFSAITTLQEISVRAESEDMARVWAQAHYQHIDWYDMQVIEND